MTTQLNRECKPASAQLAIYHPYPGTKLYYRSLEEGFLKNPFQHHFFHGKERQESILEQNQFPKERVMQLYEQFRSEFNKSY